MKAERANWGSGSIFRQKGSRFWWISYYRDGKHFRESSKSAKPSVAKGLLRTRLGEITSGTFTTPADRRITVEQLYQGLVDNYAMNDMASLEGAEQRWNKRLKFFFGSMRASQLGTELLNAYVLKCQADGLANGTINRDLAALKRAYNIAYRSTPRRVQQVPVFPHLKEAAPRKGFVEQAQYDELCKHATKLWLRSLLAVGYTFGFRSSELLEMRVNQVDLANQSIRLWRGETKSGEPRLVRLTQETFTLLTACLQGKGPTDYVFSRNGGKPILDFRGAWETLCATANLEGLLFHDLRRSAVRNMIRRGVPERVAMEISGHKTRSVFDRYNVVSETDLADAARKIEQGAAKQVVHSLGIVEESEQPQTTAQRVI